MKRLVALLLLASCTASQQQRLSEQLAPPSLSQQLKTRHFAEEALRDPPGNFSLVIDAVPNMVDTPLGQLPLRILKADGIDPGELFLLASIDPLTMKATPHFEFTVSEDGALAISSPGPQESALAMPLVLKQPLKGQAIWLAAISKERNSCNIASFIPSPYQTVLNDAEFTLVTAHRKGTHFQLQGRGLTPGERIVISDQSGERIRRHQVLVDQEGSFSLAIEPIVLGKLGGQAHLIISRGLLSTRLDYCWGGKLESASRKDPPFQPLVFVANRDPSTLDLQALQPRVDRLLYLS